MEFHQLKCPNCNATLEIEDGIDTFFCKYCGTKILVDGQSDAKVQAKADVRKAEIELEKQKAEYEHEYKIREQMNKQSKSFMVISGIIFFVFLVIALIDIIVTGY